MATGFAENSAKTRSPKPDRTSSRLTPDVVRKNSVTHRKARGSIRDAIRQGSDWHGLHMIPRGDGANWPFGSRTTRAADREHPDRAPCAGARHCNGGSTISEWIADAMRIAGSTNPDTLAESCR